MLADILTTTGSKYGLDETELEALSAQLRGPAEVVSPSQSGRLERPTWSALHESTPSLIVQCRGTSDVIEAIKFARERDLRVAVRGGGHSVAGLSEIAGGMLIDLSEMRGVHVDPARRLAHVQGGAVLADLDRESQAFGLATPTGRESGIGVAGLALGGGYGNLANKYGLTCDNLVEAQIVTADGELRSVSSETTPDLYWAIRGGGGNFGVVTSLTLRLHPVGPIVAFVSPVYSLDVLPEVLRNWRAYVIGAPGEVTSVVVTTILPPGPGIPDAVANQPCAFVLGVYAGDVGEGMTQMQPLRELGPLLGDMSTPMPYTVVQSAFDVDAYFPRHTVRAYWKSQYLDQLSDGAIDAFAHVARDRPTPMTLVNLYHLGGAVHAVKGDETAFAERSAPFMVAIEGHWDDPSADESHMGRVDSASNRIAEFANGGTYLNFNSRRPDEPMRTGAENGFGANLARLREIKATYDPENFFQHNTNVTSA